MFIRSINSYKPSLDNSIGFLGKIYPNIQERVHVSCFPPISHGVFLSFMDSSATTLLTNLLVFKNTLHQEFFRSVHFYRQRDGVEREVEREFVFSTSESYEEMQEATPILTPLKVLVSEVSEGYQNGVWLCIFAFHANHKPQFSLIPSLLLVTRNPKLKTIPNLLNDLHMIYKLYGKIEHKEGPQDSLQEEWISNNNDSEPSQKASPVFHQDLNCLPDEEDESEVLRNEINGESLPGLTGKKKRPHSDHIAKITLSDLVKYFDMPIAEASRNLNVGLTVLKRKCREYGIPRWPHRKIKSLDTLIHDLQEEAKHKVLKDEAAATDVIKMQRMLESEKENIKKKPFLDIQHETKRFRQVVFKIRHRARAANNNET